MITHVTIYSEKDVKELMEISETMSPSLKEAIQSSIKKKIEEEQSKDLLWKSLSVFEKRFVKKLAYPNHGRVVEFRIRIPKVDRYLYSSNELDISGELKIASPLVVNTLIEKGILVKDEDVNNPLYKVWIIKGDLQNYFVGDYLKNKKKK